MSELLDGLPSTVRALAEKYPACNCGDFGCCSSPRTIAIMEKVIELTTIHDRYCGDDGEELLWADLTTVALTAISQHGSAVEAIEYFLAVAMKEVPVFVH